MVYLPQAESGGSDGTLMRLACFKDSIIIFHNISPRLMMMTQLMIHISPFHRLILIKYFMMLINVDWWCWPLLTQFLTQTSNSMGGQVEADLTPAEKNVGPRHATGWTCLFVVTWYRCETTGATYVLSMNSRMPSCVLTLFVSLAWRAWRSQLTLVVAVIGLWSWQRISEIRSNS